jgi:hypothetical protein
MTGAGAMLDAEFVDTRRRRLIVWCIRLVLLAVVLALQCATFFPLTPKLSEVGLLLSGLSLAWALIAALLVIEALTRPQKHLARYKARVSVAELPKVHAAAFLLYPVVRGAALTLATANFLIYFDRCFPGIAFVSAIPSPWEIDKLTLQSLAADLSLNEWHPVLTLVAFRGDLVAHTLAIATALIFVGTAASVVFAWAHGWRVLWTEAAIKKVNAVIWKARHSFARTEADERNGKRLEVGAEASTIRDAQLENYHHMPLFEGESLPGGVAQAAAEFEARLKDAQEHGGMSQEEFDELSQAVETGNKGALDRLMANRDFRKQFERTLTLALDGALTS